MKNILSIYFWILEYCRGDLFRGFFAAIFAFSLGEFILPLLVSSLHHHQLWYGYSFMAMAGILIINAILLAPLKFPQAGQKAAESGQNTAKSQKSWLTTVCFALYGCASMALMIWFTQWITLFGQKQGFSTATSHLFLSLYSVGSIIGVFILFGLLSREVSPYAILLIMNVLATLMVLLLLVSHSAFLSEFASFMFGLTAASGIMQTGLNAFMEFFPDKRSSTSSEQLLPSRFRSSPASCRTLISAWPLAGTLLSAF
ncbi:MFS transporter [Lactobacillus delbrueckii subsp. bulgaricus]|nr:MFS transporter [Lactobacillus delbrueckii subsp. bulgaricus]